MATISFLNPLDQPTGRRRLLAELKDGVANHAFTSLKIIVAFAKSGPLLRMQTLIEDHRARGLRVEAIFGIDQLGTSAQALKFALLNFDRVIITGETGLTFHPKVYLFEGPQSARMFVGSNNLTVGGTESNFEGALRIDLNLPGDNANMQAFRAAWDELMPGTCAASRVLDEALLNELVQDGTVPDETTMRLTAKAAVGRPSPPRRPRSGLAVCVPAAL